MSSVKATLTIKYIKRGMVVIKVVAIGIFM